MVGSHIQQPASYKNLNCDPSPLQGARGSTKHVVAPSTGQLSGSLPSPATAG